MAVCKRCNSEIADDAKFCTSCGAVIEHRPSQIIKPEPAEKIEEPVKEIVEEKTEEPVANEKTEEKQIEKSEESVVADEEFYQQPEQSMNANTYSETTKYTPVAPPPDMMNNKNQDELQSQYSQPQYRPQAVQTDIEPPRNSKYATVSTGKWFGLTLLLAIPVVGFVTWIILMCSKNVNLKNFAKSILIWAIIAIVMSAISTALCLTVLKRPIKNIIDKFENSSSVFSEYNEAYNNIIDNI